MTNKLCTYISLIVINIIFACTSVCTRFASQYDFMSWGYWVGLAGAIGVMGAYAIGWQQILKRVELSTAYMFKGTSLIFIILLAWMLFGEQITLNNILGTCVIITGIALYAKE